MKLFHLQQLFMQLITGSYLVFKVWSHQGYIVGVSIQEGGSQVTNQTQIPFYLVSYQSNVKHITRHVNEFERVHGVRETSLHRTPVCVGDSENPYY